MIIKEKVEELERVYIGSGIDNIKFEIVSDELKQLIGSYGRDN